MGVASKEGASPINREYTIKNDMQIQLKLLNR